MFCLKFFLLNILALFALIAAQQSQQTQLDDFLQKSGIAKKTFYLSQARNGHPVYTNLDDFRDVFSDFRVFQMQQFKRNERGNLQLNRQRGKLQPKIPKSQKFPCPLNGTRSEQPPTSVHRLRPGDIDIIAAMGDSLSAGTAILATSLLQETAEFRGLTMTGGGLKDWRTYLTLPNILKVFNPNLYGYAIGNTLARARAARFNLGEPNAMTLDMPFQALVLIKRLTKDPKVDMAKHWKLITLLIGANDVCSDMCYYDKLEDFFSKHRNDLYRTLKILQTQVPRLLVSILPVPNIPESFLSMRNLPFTCFATQRYACSCIIGQRSNSPLQMKRLSQAAKRVQEIDREVANLPEFQTENFAVVYQPFTANLSTPQLKNGDTDLRYFAVDCFHFSQLGQALASNMLWNNMLQREGQKDLILLKLFEKFECPSKERPYIATRRNSLN